MGRRRIHAQIAELVLELHAERVPQRAIQRRLALRGIAISRGVIGDVVHGRWRPPAIRGPRPADVELNPGEERIAPTRCGGCGGLTVIAPCRLCASRAELG